MDWIPALLTNVTVSDKHVKGIVRTKRELESIIEIHRKQFNCSFVLVSIRSQIFHILLKTGHLTLWC